MSYQIIQLIKYEHQGKEKTTDRLIKSLDSFEEIVGDFEKHVSNIDPDDRVNLFFTPQECSSTKRDSVSQDNLFFDIDDVPQEYAEKVGRVTCEALNVNYNETLVIHSGNGLHLVIGLTDKLIVTATAQKDPNSDYRKYMPHYRALCDKINKALRENDLPGKADDQVFSRAHMVRYPNTHNIKKKKAPSVSELMQGEFKRINYDIIEMSGVKEKIEAPRADSMSNSVVDKFYPNPDTEAILEGCNFLKWGKEFPEQVTEPMWFAGASVFRKLDNGEELFQEWSKGHPNYSKQETADKFYNVEGGPRLCETIDRMWGQCKECPNFQKVKSPIAIKGETYLKTKQYGFFNFYIEEGKIVLTTPNYPELLKEFEMEFVFKSVPHHKVVYVYNGKYYEPKEEHDILAWAASKLDIDKQRNSHRIEFFKLLMTKNIVTPNWFKDTTARKANLQNGIFDMKDMELHDHSPEYGFRSILPYDFDKNADCPVFDKFMNDITGEDIDLQTILREYMGYCLSGDEIWFDKAILLSGDGSNGKSTLLNLLKKLAGRGNYSSLMTKSLFKEEHRYQLDGALFNICEEMPKSIDEGSDLKNIISGGDVVIKKLYSQSYTITNTAKMIFTCNELPQTGDSSYGIVRRFVIVPFERVFSEKLGNLDMFISKKLEKELSGIFWQVMVFYKSVLSRGVFTKSERSSSANKEFEILQSSINEFIEDYLEFGEEYEVEKQFLYTKYSEFCTSGNSKPLSRTNFYKNLMRKLPGISWNKQNRTTKQGQRIRTVRGVRVRSSY